MNKRDRAIITWVQRNRPDIESHITHCLTAPSGSPLEGVQLCMALAFEAGRLFQFNNPKATLHNPNIYLE